MRLLRSMFAPATLVRATLVRAKFVLAMFVVAATAGCATQSPRPPAAGDGADAQALYAKIQPAVSRYRRGRALESNGEPEGAGERAAALSTLQAAAGDCAALAGCDATRFFAAYEGLLHDDPGASAGEGFAADLAQAADAPRGEGSPIMARLPQAARSINLLKGRELRDVIALNGPVQAALAQWLTWMRPQLVDAWEHYQYMRHRMWPEYQRAGLPEALLFGILAKESGGKVHAVSRAGASGPLQFMPATGRRFGLGDAGGFDTRFDPQLATRANVAYLNERFGEFNDNLELALAAYNGGEGRVKRLYQGTRGKPFWDPEVYWQLPPETRDYVPMVLAAAWLFLHPEEYGLSFPTVEPAPARLPLEADTTIDALAICLGDAGSRDGWFRTLRNLNPRYMSNTELPAGTVLEVPERLLVPYRERCVSGAHATAARQLASAQRPAPVPVREVTVRQGETLNGIAQRHGCSVRALADANGLQPPRYMIRVGQRLKLTGCRG
ncbi:MAG TPA: transglycosylase SLT domain-containing protein [Xanthomonadaceae bacterium]|nr:transglycosylase SLT domain-containing protein [Xanthomonadaceae bacterium]